MITPNSINRIIVRLGAAVGLLSAALALREPLIAAIDRLLKLDSLLLAAFAAIGAAAVTFYIMTILMFREIQKHKKVLQERIQELTTTLAAEKRSHKATSDLLEAAKYNLRDSEKLKYADVVTGIPNESKWREDIREIEKKVSIKSPFQNIFIDLDGFRNINTEYGYTTGDEVIRYFAQNIYDRMRRNEFIYKQRFSDDQGERIYRKYTGGDEFLFIIKGEEADALGFLNALQNRIKKEFNPYIEQKLGRPHLLSFHGAIWPMDTEDDGDSVLRHLQEALRIASQPGSKSRVWYSGRNSPEIRDLPRVKNIYAEAKVLFGKNE